MKKTRFLALALVVAIALMGAGYAAWSDNLVVSSKVNNGRLDVDFTKVQKIGTDPCWVTVTDNIVSDGEIKCGDAEPTKLNDPMTNRDKLEITIDNFWPGAVVTRRVTVTNTGTIPVKIERSKLGDKNYTVQSFGVLGVEEDEDEVEVEIVAVEEGATTFGHSPQPTYYEIAVNGSRTFDIKFTFNKNSGNSSQCKTKTYTFDLPFEQADCKQGPGC